MAMTDPISLLSPQLRRKHNLEKIMENHLLVSRNDIILTSYNSFNSREAVERILETTIVNIHCFFENNLQNVVNPTW
jgi:D-lactate dehydrogenase